MRCKIAGLLLLAAPAAHADDGGAPVTAAFDRPGAAALRAQKLVDEAAAAERARSGAVAPGWRDVERALQTRFHPAAADVTSRPAAQLLAAQLHASLRNPRPAAPGDGPT